MGNAAAFAAAIGKPGDCQGTHQSRALHERQEQPATGRADAVLGHEERHQVSHVDAGAASRRAGHEHQRCEQDIAIPKALNIGVETCFGFCLAAGAVPGGAMIADPEQRQSHEQAQRSEDHESAAPAHVKKRE